MTYKNPLLTHAHDYAEHLGWAIVPVVGKSAKCCQWKRYQKVKPDRKQRGGLFSRKGVTGLAVILGEVSGGLRVRDYDDAGAYSRWAETHPDLAVSLPTARTHCGYHVYFRADIPEGVSTFSDGELRAGNCIVVLPPSQHPDGGHYEWLLAPKGDIPVVSEVEDAGLLGPAPVAVAEPTPVPPAVADAIAKTLPQKTGERHNLIFKFARRLKGIAGLDTSAEALSAYIAEWHRQAEPFIKTKDFLTTELAFYDSWRNAEVPLSDEQFWSLVTEALKKPAPEWFAGWFFPASGKRLLTVCMALQARAGDEPFFLSARMAGDTVAVAAKDAHALLKRLIREGFLQEVEKGTLAKKLATTWRYTGPAE